MENWELEDLAAQCRFALASQGLSIRVVHDQEEATRLTAAMCKRHSGILDPTKNVFTKRSAMWIFAMQDGLPRMKCGMRVDDLDDEPLGLFLQRALNVVFKAGLSGDAWDTVSQDLHGRAVYCGDFAATLANGLAPNGARAIQYFTTYVHHRAFTDFAANFTYCFLRESQRARAKKYGFLDADAFAWASERTLYVDGNPGWIAALRKKRQTELFEAVGSTLLQSFAVNQKPLLPTFVGHATPNSDKREAHM